MGKSSINLRSKTWTNINFRFFLKRMKNTNEYDDCLYLSDDLISEWWLLISKQRLISRWYLSVGILPGHHTPDSVGRKHHHHAEGRSGQAEDGSQAATDHQVPLQLPREEGQLASTQSWMLQAVIPTSLLPCKTIKCSPPESEELSDWEGDCTHYRCMLLLLVENGLSVKFRLSCTLFGIYL